MAAAQVYEEEEWDDSWHENQVWNPEPAVEDDPVLIDRAALQLPSRMLGLRPSEFTEFAFRMPRKPPEKDETPEEYEARIQAIRDAGQDIQFESFSFTERPYMRRIYDTPTRRVLLLCARQVEKCGWVEDFVSLANGGLLRLGDVRVGDQVSSMAHDGASMTTRPITWVSKRRSKSCVRLTTRQGHEVVVADTHPMRVWDGWLKAAAVIKGQRVAVVRKAGIFTDNARPTEERIRLTAYLIGDGSMTDAVGFTSLPGAKLDEFVSDLSTVGVTYSVFSKRGTPAVSVRLHKGIVHSWLYADTLMGCKSVSKFIPPWVFDLSEKNTALFLNRLWSTDGHVKQNGPSKFSIEYCSISKRLIREIQSLLWKFGIPSKIRKNWPNIYKKRGEVKLAYILRVETQEGVRRFVNEIGALGKDLIIDSFRPDNNNRDTYPIEINDLIRRIVSSKGNASRYGAGKRRSLRSVGLRETLEYAPSKDRLQRYVGFFRGDCSYDQRLVDELARHADTDLFWDEVVKVERVGQLECVDFEVSDTHNFVTNGFVTHNSTLLGNVALCYMSLIPSFKILYVNSSATQAKVFSNDRVKEPIDTSLVLKKFTTKMLSSNIFEKQFVNRSKLTIRYAFLNADRTRGIPAYGLAIDEFQDILGDNIPVIEQCQAHAPAQYVRRWYAGTPKSLDNPIESYWSTRSTQNQWVIPHGCTGGDAGRFWNVLGEKNIGKKSLVCSNCKKPLNPMAEGATWASMQAMNLDDKGNPVGKITFEGYRIPQLMVPWKPWHEIVSDYEVYPRDKFYNEVLGISFDSGLRPLTRAQVEMNCRENIRHVDAENYRGTAYSNPVFAGIDWGTAENSYTVITLATYVDMKFRVFYWHRFEGEDTVPEITVKKIIELIEFFNVKVIGVDYGGGFDRNDTLTRKFGPTSIMKFQYQARSVKKVAYNQKLGRFQVARTEVMSDVFNAIKRGNVFEFPRAAEFMPIHGQDMLNIYSEFNEKLRMVQYGHRVDKTDDSFHSLLYCFLASMAVRQRPDVIAPTREVDGRPVSRAVGPIDQG